MREKLKFLVVLFSIVLNIVFVGTYIYHKLARGHDLSNNHGLLYEELNLSSEQLEQFKPARNDFHAFLNKQSRLIKVKRLELIDLLDRENPDRLIITAKQIEIETLQDQMQKKVIDHLLEESTIFTSSQRTQFYTLIKERIGKSNLIRPGWMPHAPANSVEGNHQ